MSDHQTLPVTAEDLAQFDDVYEGADVSDGGFEPVPDGTYQARVEAVELTRTQKGNPKLKWTLEIVGPTHQGRLLWRHNQLGSDENVRWLKKDLWACDVKLERTSELPANMGRLLDIHLEVVKKTRGEYDSVYINKRIRTPEDDPSGALHEGFARF